MSKSTIEWTEETWNVSTGCNKVSAGCKNCYAERMSKRLCAMGQEKYKNGFKLTMHPDSLNEPYSWRQPKLVFVNSMSDLFHEDVTDEFIHKVFEVMNNKPLHTFQVLTKRAERLYRMRHHLRWTDNIWVGVSVESELVLDRVKYLRTVPAKVRFLSCEPLLGPLSKLNLLGIHWVVVGGESGPKSRPIKKEWVEEILAKCRLYNTKFFFKQWGGTRKKVTGRILNGKLYNEMPAIKIPVIAKTTSLNNPSKLKAYSRI